MYVISICGLLDRLVHFMEKKKSLLKYLYDFYCGFSNLIVQCGLLNRMDVSINYRHNYYPYVFYNLVVLIMSAPNHMLP